MAVPEDDVPITVTPLLPEATLKGAREALERAKAADDQATRDRDEVRRLTRMAAHRRANRRQS